MASNRTAGELIREAIENGPIGLSQKTVARRAGISEKHLSQIIRGGVRMSARVAVRLEGPLGVPAMDLLVAQALADVAVARAKLTSTPPPEGATLVLCTPLPDGRWHASYEHGANETHVLLPRGVKPAKTWTADFQAEAEAGW
ncbi:helix-turn-helix transcriptional regulator [Amycolatopsis sp. NPDC021455]|uniref:helix-turn-helix transcriptional regulator n=1 Tax=Amycolatopsis sp. NPDC021455 TaxID=3154901 RepID=UPI0033EEA50C